MIFPPSGASGGGPAAQLPAERITQNLGAYRTALVSVCVCVGTTAELAREPLIAD